ncbi:hypothetical protein [Chromohalobacter israelensis]|uniref:hypothetical protein n=1 Tax=Chromohalobacter israelensis TaxID=141390 RepID=UPI000FFE7A76|nr:hypothetical protein [Chromohalobacter salexigens]
MSAVLRLLRAVPLWVWPLLAVLGWGGWQWWRANDAAAELAETQADLVREQVRANALDAALAWKRDEVQRLAETLGERQAQLDQDATDIEQHRAAARQLERNDADTRRWADRPVPAATREWLRKLGTDNASGDDAHDPGDADRPTARTDTRDQS